MSRPLPQSDLDSIVARCANLWPLLGKRLFITGGTGFIGRWMVESFNRLWFPCKLIELNRPYDIRSFDISNEADYILHLASVDSSADETADVIVNGTRRVLEFAKQSGCQRMLNVSSGAAGIGNTVYGQSKRLAESLCDESGVPVVHCRLFACSGPGLQLDRGYALGNFIRDALAGGPIRVRGDGLARRSYIYATDLAVALWHLLLKGETQTKYEVGGGTAYTISDVANCVADQFYPRPEVQIEGWREQTADGDYIPFIGPAMKALGLTHEVGMREGVRRMVEWHRPTTNGYQRMMATGVVPQACGV